MGEKRVRFPPGPLFAIAKTNNIGYNTDMSAELLLNGVVETATLGRFGVTNNPQFAAEWEKILAEKRNLMTKIHDTGTVFIIDDQNHRIVSRFSFVRKK